MKKNSSDDGRRGGLALLRDRLRGRVRSFESVTLHVSGMRHAVDYEILMLADHAQVSAYAVGYRDGEAVRRLEKRAACSGEDALELMNRCRLLSWDGFHGKHPRGVKDGETFSLKASVNGGRKIEANGSQNFPRHYREFRDGLRALFEKSRQIPVDGDKQDTTEKGRGGVTLSEFTYSPGYSDMRGARHCERLAKDADGAWTLVCEDRESFDAPTVVTTYAVSAEKAAEFEAFLLENKAASLADRGMSGDFACDYHPWEFRIVFENLSAEKRKRVYRSFDQYKKYSEEDEALIRATRERFRALRGEKLSETAVKPE